MHQHAAWEDVHSTALLEAAFDAAVDGMVVIDEHGRIEIANAAVERIFGYPPSELVGLNVSRLMGARDRERHDDYVSGYVDGTKPRRVIGIGREVVGARADGSRVPLLLSVAETRIDGLTHFVGVLHDISDLAHTRDELAEARTERDEYEQRARTDGLTGLHNREYLQALLEAELEAAGAAETLAVVMVDIDHFKRINDEYGHPFGDAVLQTVARRLANSIRRHDQLARWGGEEFCILLRRVTDAEALWARVQECRQAISARPIGIGDATVAVTVSAGAVSSRSRLDAASLVAAADDALYQAKRAGRDRIQIAAEHGQRITP